MASFDFCVDQAFKAGKITKDVAEKIKAADDPETAINQIAGDLTRQKREAAIQSVRLAEQWKNIEDYAAKADDRGAIMERIFGKKNKMYAGLMALLARDQAGQATYFNIDMLSASYHKEFMSKWAEAMSRFRTRSLGFEQDEEGLVNFARAVYGETVDDADIMRFAEDWHKTTEFVRKKFNAAGGSISKNEKWLMPQNHDFRAIEAVGKDAWKEKIIHNKP